MKIASFAFAAALWLSVLANSSLLAQTNPPALTATAIATNADQITNAVASAAPVKKRVSGEHMRLDFNLTDVVAIAGSYALPIIIVGLIFFFRHRRHQMVNETLRLMIEKGAPITPELVDSLRGRSGRMGNGGAWRQRKDLRVGLILVSVGAGVVIVAGKAGWIVFFIGVAFLIVWLFERNKTDPQPPK